MPKPYSADLRERVLLADEAGLPPPAVAQRFGIGLATVYLWRQRRARRGGAVPSRMEAGGRGGLTRRARRSCGRWWPSATIVRWMNTESCWRYAAVGRRSAVRPCAAPCGGSGYGAKKDAAGQRARSHRHPSGAGSLLRTGAAARRQEPGLPRRERHYHGDDPPLCPRAARRAGARLGPGRLATADRPGGAVR